IAAFAGNLAIAITKAIAAFVTGSGALLAETAHSIADSVNQILLYVGIRRSVRPASERHPLGHGKERYFWALIVALFLFFGGRGVGLRRVAYPLPWSGRGLSVGEAPAEEVLDGLRAAIATEPGVDKIVDLRAVQMGTNQLLVLARVSVRDDIPTGDAERLLA